jgi:hypothetical protein
MAIVGVGGIAGLFALWSARPVEGADQPALSPSQVIAQRFPSNWVGPTPTPVSRIVASADARSAIPSSLFDPKPTYELASVSSSAVPSDDLPLRASAYADPGAEGLDTSGPAKATPEQPTVHEKPVVHEKRAAPPRVAAKQTGAVFNDAQIASIKRRLRLTQYQESLWPGVEAALRNINYKKNSGRAGRMATVDPNSPGVQQLKSAAFPLIMSFSEEQKDEVRQLARLMGLEQVASSF